ncbi:MAG: hypothetical protein ACI9MN_000815, partial [Saprospiraceae bacterium]
MINKSHKTLIVWNLMGGSYLINLNLLLLLELPFKR